ncbi:MAG: S-layer homology domain-containing protein [Oscillospiraceae bacterium]|nr:S-layer homology domain-containing protein [Oscillospiraceae bacterium]
MTGDVTANAAFGHAQSSTITVKAGTNGSAISVRAGYGDTLENLDLQNNRADVVSGMKIEFTAHPAPGYMVDRWLVDGVAQDEVGNVFIIDPHLKNTEVEVTFKETVHYGLPGDDVTLNPVNPPLAGGTPVLTEVHISYLFGFPDGTIRPDGQMTRAQVATVFYRLMAGENKDAPIQADFPDVKNGAWYYQAVGYMASLGLLDGYPDGSFRPDNNITRAEFAKIAAQFTVPPEHISQVFSDMPLTHWAAEYIAACSARKWILGFQDDTFRPNNRITRAESVAILNRMMDRRIEPADLPPDAPFYTDLDPSHWAYADIVEASSDHTYERKDNGYEIWLD